MLNEFFGGKDSPWLIWRCVDFTLYLSLALLTAGMLIVVALQVYYRFVLNDPLDWSEEVARYLFVWLSFLGAAVGVRHRVHLGIDTLEKSLDPQKYRYIATIINLVILLFLGFIFFFSFRVLNVVGHQSSPAVGISMLYPYLAVPVGALFMGINLVRITVEIWTGTAKAEFHVEETI